MRVLSVSVFISVLSLPGALAQTGKIAGQVIDESGVALPGVNLFIPDTFQGATTDADGYYTILNVSPGTYTLRSSFVGYITQTVEGVRVNIDQTRTVDFQLVEDALGLGEIVVTAELPVVQADVSNSQLNVTSEQIEALPVSSINSVVGLQAGVQGLSVRGSGSDELSFMVNGLTMRDERNNAPYTSISLSSVEEVQVQTGGFNAEYGNVRSGVVNVVTKEGYRDRYTGSAILRYSSPAQKHFGVRADDPNAYWIRPFLDPDVAYTGTESGGWDEFTQAQYPRFEGWIAISEERLKDDDPSNDMTPEALQQAFLWQHRKPMEVVRPDYNVDVGLGGPVPFVSQHLGDLRFYASVRADQNRYLIPLNSDRYQEWSGHLKMTADLKSGMKLTLEGLRGRIMGTSLSRVGQPGVFRSSFSIAG